jgi:hypothetical protein
MAGFGVQGYALAIAGLVRLETYAFPRSAPQAAVRPL